jgi:hypothetical protein
MTTKPIFILSFQIYNQHGTQWVQMNIIAVTMADASKAEFPPFQFLARAGCAGIAVVDVKRFTCWLKTVSACMNDADQTP